MEGYGGGTDTGDLGLHISLTDSNTHIAHIYVVLLSSHTCKQLAPLAPLAAPRATSHNPRVACSLAGSSSAIATATPRATAAAACSGLSNAHEIGLRGREETHATPEAAAPFSIYLEVFYLARERNLDRGTQPRTARGPGLTEHRPPTQRLYSCTYRPFDQRSRPRTQGRLAGRDGTPRRGARGRAERATASPAREKKATLIFEKPR